MVRPEIRLMEIVLIILLVRENRQYGYTAGILRSYGFGPGTEGHAISGESRDNRNLHFSVFILIEWIYDIWLFIVGLY